MFAVENMMEEDGSSRYGSYEYNDHNDVVSQTNSFSILANGKHLREHTEVTFSYVYDRKGNWIKRFASLNGSKMMLEMRRKIYYY